MQRKSGSFPKRLLAGVCASAFALSLAGCQKTPETEILIGKTNAGWAQAAAAPSDTPYAAPARYTGKFNEGNLEIVLDADVAVPQAVRFPIYLMRPKNFSQEEAAGILNALLEGQTLYTSTNEYTKDWYQKLIRMYAEEMQRCEEEADRAWYLDLLKELTESYEAAPETASREPASRALAANPTHLAERRFAKKVWKDARTMRYVWTAQSAREAQAAGYVSIVGDVWQACGRKMTLRIENLGTEGAAVWFAEGAPDQPGARGHVPAPDFTLAEGQAKADALLDRMGIAFQSLGAEESLGESGGAERFLYFYCAAVPGTEACRIDPANNPDASEVYAKYLGQERITVMLDGGGIAGFRWEYPAEAARVEQENVELLPWEQVAEIVELMLGVKTVWADAADAAAADIVARRLEIHEIRLSYMQVRRDAELLERYYIPVWDVCGRLYYRYGHAVEGQGFTLDENLERNAYAGYSRGDAVRSVLTVNAVDGTVIDRAIGY